MDRARQGHLTDDCFTQRDSVPFSGDMRLKICSRKILDYPMRDEHLHFLRNAGLFKHLVADIPAALISGILLYRTKVSPGSSNSVICELPAVFGATDMLCCKLLLIAWGCAKSSLQLHLTGSYGVDMPTKETYINAEGETQVQTAMSRLMYKEARDSQDLSGLMGSE